MPIASSPFSAGPRLIAAPRGDPATEAIASLRGYAYQLYASALAWLDLKAGQELYLEVAKDYAIAAADALKAVEVKDTGPSSVTMNSADVRETLNAYVNLVERNPERFVHVRFLSTSPIGQERKRADRIDGKAALNYWRHAAAGADVAPLRERLCRLQLSSQARVFIQARNDPELRDEFLKRIHWDCGRPGLDEIRAELQAGLIRYGLERLRLPPAKGRELGPVVLHHILTTTIDHAGCSIPICSRCSATLPASRCPRPISMLSCINSSQACRVACKPWHRCPPRRCRRSSTLRVIFPFPLFVRNARRSFMTSCANFASTARYL
jgi:hypothetical protein